MTSRAFQYDRGIGWAKYVWLVYLLFYFAWLVVQPATPAVWALSILAVAAFLPLYLYGFKVTGWRLLATATAIYALGALMMPVNPRGELHASSFSRRLRGPDIFGVRSTRARAAIC
jgi:hypothetical protein